MNSARDEIASKLRQLYKDVIDPVADNLAFEHRASDGEIAAGPTVLVVGNHSSGKSTFINHLIGEPIQKTGMAPTDDCFTILSYDERREERDGHSIVGNPELAFGDLKQFGPDFLNHFRMRLVPSERLKNVTLIDTPGMIDASDPNAGRGYDFGGVVRSLASQADLVMVFFDPERPGTTTETLKVLTTLLGNIDHKLLLVMNKMDLFRSMRDFARTYGTLCWNLGKVINKKDMPQIYTTYVPVEGAAQPIMDLGDFEEARRELIQAIESAPGKRMENMLTQCSLYAERLLVYSSVIDRAHKHVGGFSRNYQQYWFLITLLILVGTGGAWYFEFISLQLAAWITGGTIVASAAAWLIGKFLKQQKIKQVEKRLDEYFEDVFRRDLVVTSWEGEIRRQWSTLKQQILRALNKVGFQDLKKVRGGRMKRLRKAVEHDIPKLRADLHKRPHTTV